MSKIERPRRGVALADTSLLCSWFYATDYWIDPLDLDTNSQVLDPFPLAANFRAAGMESTVR